MPSAIRKINVIGHQHPDTDSICAAISYAYLKNQKGDGITYQARRAGNLNRETAFVLKHFGFEEPRLITSVTPQLKDADIQYTVGIGKETSLYAAWTLMRELKMDTLYITDEQSNLLGLIAIKDIASANMDIFDTAILGDSRTSYINVLDTLSATMVCGDPEGIIDGGKILVGTTPEALGTKLEEGDIILVTNLEATQRYAIEHGAKCLIICCDVRPSDEIVALARTYASGAYSETPQYIDVDSHDGNTVILHLYDMVSDGATSHTGTIDWLYIDRYTLEGTNLLGDYVHL